MKRHAFCWLIIFLLWGVNCCWAEEIAVIVNRANSLESPSIAQLARIYKGQQRQWSDGRQIVVVNRPVDSVVRKLFYRKVLKSKPTQKFSQPGTPIPFRSIVQRSSLATIRFVNNLPEAIGYIYSSELELDEKNTAIKIVGLIEVDVEHIP